VIFAKEDELNEILQKYFYNKQTSFS